MTQDRTSDLTADLLLDLNRPAPLPSAPPVPPSPLTTPARAVPATPAVTLTLTPLRWSLPSLDATERGLGLALRAGPWRVEVAF